MKDLLIASSAMIATAPPFAHAANFDADAVGSVPDGWTCGVTGSGSPHWAVAADTEAPGIHHVLTQTGSGTFPWCVRIDTAIADGFVGVKFKPISGREDQAGGVVWRFKDRGHYYVARANALENNVSLYYTERGRRTTLKYVDAPVARCTWHTLRVEFAGAHIAVSLDGKRTIEIDDPHISGPGAVGVWTKADSVTSFDDFVCGANP